MSSKLPDTTLWQTACAEIEKVRQYSPEQRKAYFDAARVFPPMISMGRNGHVFTTREGVAAIEAISEAWRALDAQRKARIDAERMRHGNSGLHVPGAGAGIAGG